MSQDVSNPSEFTMPRINRKKYNTIITWCNLFCRVWLQQLVWYRSVR